MVFVILCAVLGYWLRGATGLLIGAGIGYVVRELARVSVQRRLERMRSHFVETTFSVMGALCKADGVVSKEEIDVAQRTFVRLDLSEEQTKAAKAAFTRGKESTFDLDGTVAAFAATAPPGSVLFQVFLQLQLEAVAADGEIHPAEHAMLVRIARRLGLPEAAVRRLEALLRATAAGAASSGVPPPQRQLEDAYATLGVTPDISEADLKRAYKKLIVENHPDRLAAKGLPESMKEMAQQRAREINAAYQVIKKARGFT